MTSNKMYVGAGALMKRYGITRSSVHRWVHDEALGMPQPVRRRGRLYWDLVALDAWDAARAARDPAVDTAVMRERFKKKKAAGPANEAA